jgi:hypothetical protein
MLLYRSELLCVVICLALIVLVHCAIVTSFISDCLMTGCWIFERYVFVYVCRYVCVYVLAMVSTLKQW